LKLNNLSYSSVEQWILNQCIDKSVLHLGCAGDYTLLYGKEASIHWHLEQKAKYIYGIELNKDSLDALKILCPENVKNRYFIGNVEKLSDLRIEEKFDVIVAGSIIEHLSNPGQMLTEIRPFCHENTLLLISTPHVWGLLQFLRVAFTRNEAVNPEHTCWFSIPTLSELLSRHGFIPVEFNTGYGWKPSSIIWSIKKGIGTRFFRIFPHLGGSLLASFKLKMR